MRRVARIQTLGHSRPRAWCESVAVARLHTTMSAPEAGNDGSSSPPPSDATAGAAGAAPAASALAARELPSAVNSKKLLDEHLARTGGKVRLYWRRRALGRFARMALDQFCCGLARTMPLCRIDSSVRKGSLSAATYVPLCPEM